MAETDINITRRRTYNYIERLVNRITKADQPLNDSFTYYHRQVVLQSCMRDFCVVIVILDP